MIKVADVTKKYGSYQAVDHVCFECHPGSVTGFLGPNGAGKSTTLRILVGLTPPTSGAATIAGAPYRDIANPGTRVGVLLDASAQHAGRTGREVLTMGALQMGLPHARVEQMLELVSLSRAESGRRIRDYSLGMRQRLGIAHALLGDPEVLILDEPANGLDPAGIHWMRRLLKGYAEGGGTVLLSSHLLHEVEVIADELIVIGQGRIVAQGSRAEMLRGAGAYARSLDRDALIRTLDSAGIGWRPATDQGLLVEADPDDIGRAAAAAGVALGELRPADGSGLEAIFLELTGETQRDTTTDGAAA